MNLTYNNHNLPVPKTITLCDSSHQPICTLNGIQTESVELVCNYIDIWTLTFNVNRYIDIDGVSSVSNGYDDIKANMYLFLEDIGYFWLDTDPAKTNDGNAEVMSVTAKSAEAELMYKNLFGWKVNTGETDSAEYLDAYVSQYTPDNTSNISEEGLAINYCTVYNKDNPYLSILDLALQKAPGWSVGYVDPAIADQKFQFSIDNQNIYSFFREDFTKATSSVVVFDFLNYTVNVYTVSQAGKIYGTAGEETNITISYRNLAKNISLQCDDSSIFTAYKVAGGDGIDTVAYANFGDSYIYNIDYYLTEPYIEQELIDKYIAWRDYRDSRREEYITASKNWVTTSEKATELYSRVPVSNIQNDFNGYTYEELYKYYVLFNSYIYNIRHNLDYYSSTELIDVSKEDVNSYLDDTQWFYVATQVISDVTIYKFTNVTESGFEDKLKDRFEYATYSGYKVILDHIITALNNKLITEGINGLNEQKSYFNDELSNLTSNPKYQTDGKFDKYLLLIDAKVVTYNALTLFIQRVQYYIDNFSTIDHTKKEEISTDWEHDWDMYGVAELENQQQLFQEKLDILSKAGYVLKYLYYMEDLEHDGEHSALRQKYDNLPDGEKSKFSSYEEYVNKHNEAYNSNTYLIQVDKALAQRTAEYKEMSAKSEYYSQLMQNITEDVDMGAQGETIDTNYTATLDAYQLHIDLAQDATDSYSVNTLNEINRLINSINNHITDLKTRLNGDSLTFDEIQEIQTDIQNNTDTLQQIQDLKYGLIATNTSTLDDYIAFYENKLATIETRGKQYSNNRHGFDDDDYLAISRLYRYTDYQNENYITVSTDSTEQIVDKHKQLYDYAVEELVKSSQPQYSFECTLDNLLAMPEFKEWHEDLSLGNFIYLGFRDDYVVRLRIMTITYNPLEPRTDSLSITFTNMLKGSQGIDDFIDLLGQSTGQSQNSISAGNASHQSNGELQLTTEILQMIANSSIMSQKLANATNQAINASAVNANSGFINNLNTQNFTTENMSADSAFIKYLEANVVTASELTTDKLVAGIADIQLADIEDAVIKNAFIDNLQTFVFSSVVSTSTASAVQSFLATYITADVIDAKNIFGDYISTNTFTIKSDDGLFVIKDNTLQINESYTDDNGDTKTATRIQIGLDEQGNYNFLMLSRDGEGVIMNENGITENAIADDLIKSNMLASKGDGYSGIDASKLDIDSFMAVINDADSGYSISSDKVFYKDSTLYTTMNKLTTTVQSVVGALRYTLGISSSEGTSIKSGASTTLQTNVYDYSTGELVDNTDRLFTYKWYRNGVLITTTEKNTLVVKDTDIVNGAQYTCRVTYTIDNVENSTSSYILLFVEGERLYISENAPSELKDQMLWLDLTDYTLKTYDEATDAWTVITTVSSEQARTYETMVHNYYTKEESNEAIQQTIGSTTITRSNGQTLKMIDAINTTLDTSDHYSKVIESQEQTLNDLEQKVVASGDYSSYIEYVYNNDAITETDEDGTEYISDGGTVTIKCKVFHKAIDVTDQCEDANFIWYKESDNKEDDKIWNANQYQGKQITVSASDIGYSTVFGCDIVVDETDVIGVEENMELISWTNENGETIVLSASV